MFKLKKLYYCERFAACFCSAADKMAETKLPDHSFLRSSNLNLNTFVAINLQPTEQFNRDCKSATGALADYLKQESILNIAEVVKV